MTSKLFDESTLPLYSATSEDGSYSDLEQIVQHKPFSSRFSRVFFLLNVTLFAFTLVLFASSVRQQMGMLPAQSNAIKETSYFSPLFDQIDIRLETVEINGTLLNTNPPSIYRQDPSPAVDAAWDRISNVRTVSMGRDDVIKLGKDPLIAAKYPLDFGLGPNAFIAEVDVFHQIHCLNSLRKEIFFEHYFTGKYPENKPSTLHRTHTSHCIYILLQNLMCSASVDLITHRWLDVQQHPFPDFNINKKCRNFEDVLAWQERNVVDDAPYHDLRRPVDDTPVSTSDAFKDLFHQWNYVLNDDVHGG